MNQNIELKILEGYLSRHRNPAITEKLHFAGNSFLVFAVLLIMAGWAYEAITAGQNSTVLLVSCFGAGFMLALGITIRAISRSFTVINEYIGIERVEQRIQNIKNT
jgi:hypothetical protein